MVKKFSTEDMKPMNTTHIYDNIGQYEAARSNFFVFAVNKDELANLLHPEEDPNTQADSAWKEGSSEYYNPDDVYEYLKLNVVKASVPNFTVDVKEYRRGNDVVKFAGVPTFADGEITVDDVVGLHVKDMLYAWLYLAYNPISRAGGRMADYKKTCTLIEYTQDYQKVREWTLQGCFVTGITEGEFDRENDEKRQLQVAISYDRAIMEPNHDAF